jgi:hypothetical protein
MILLVFFCCIFEKYIFPTLLYLGFGMELLFSFSLAQENGGYWNGPFTLIFFGPHSWPKGMGGYCNRLLLSFSLARTRGPREWGLLEWTFYSHFHWPTSMTQGNGRLLEWNFTLIPIGSHLWPMGMGGCWNGPVTLILVGPHS